MQENRPSRPEDRETRKERRIGSKKRAQTAETGGPETSEAGEAEEELAPEPELEQAADTSQSAVQAPFPQAARLEDASHREEQASASPPSARKARKLPANSLRASLAVVGGRTAGALSRRLHLGGGASIAGVVAQRLYPNIVEHLSTQLQQGSILVTGTNGKTTTSGFIAAILRDSGLRVWRNREGSNLMGGIAGALVIRTLPNGRLRRAGKAISIFEVDEAVMPQAAQTIPTRVAVFTNLFRDQLDRYGEVDTVLERWKGSVKALAPETTLILNADDPAVASLGEHFAGRVIYFGIEDKGLDLEQQEGVGDRHQVIDSRTCPNCGGDYTYSLRFYSHIGHYTCTQCGQSRPKPQVYASRVENDSFDRLRIQVEAADFQGEIIVPLPGLYNVYNALAAVAAAQALGTAWAPVTTGIEQFKPAFGRGERVQIAKRTARMLLAKNPTGFNEVLRTLSTGSSKRHVLFVLNDNIADGRDISWIWDIDFEQALESFATVSVAGTRARDLALRLKYAGLDPRQVTIVPSAPLRAERKERRGSPPAKKRSGKRRTRGPAVFSAPAPLENEAAGTPQSDGLLIRQEKLYGIAQALDQAVGQTPEGETLYIVPTYTGLLEIHRELERRGLTPHYWEETGP
jgi:lipid II isoglutaminyl synthase (glutamine-hydrolysing)